MPAFFGALVGEPGEVDLCGDFAELKVLPEQRVDVHRFGPLCIASVERPADPPRLARCRRTGAALLLKGVAHIPPEPAREGLEGHPDARAVLARVIDEGRHAAAGLPGHYVAILWEPRAERLSLMTDELGLYPIRTAVAGRSFLFGTTSWAFERSRWFRREPDPEAVVEFLRAEHLLGDRCMSRGVSLIPPGAILGVERGLRPAVRPARDPFRAREPAPPTLDDAAEALGAAYDEAFARAIPRAGPILVPLSGGKDSRTVLCETLRAAGGNARVSAFTLGSADHWDAICARRVARAARVPWRLVPLDETLHDRWLDRHISICGGSASVFATWWAGVLERIEDPETAIASGFLGDALSGAHLRFFHPGFERARLPGEDGGAAGETEDPGVERLLARLDRRCFSRDALARLLRRDVAEAWLDAPERALRESTLELAGAPRHVRMIRTDILHRQRRFIASQLHVYRQRHRVAAPLADPAVVRAFLSFTEEHVRDQRAYALALARRHPRAARVIEARSRRPLTGGRAERLRAAAEVLWVRAREAVRVRLLGAPSPNRDFFAFRHAWSDDLARSVEPLDWFLDPDALRRALAAEPPGSNRLRILYTLRAWLRRMQAGSSATRFGRAA